MQEKEPQRRAPGSMHLNGAILNPRLVELALPARDWREAVIFLAQRMWREGRIASLDAFIQRLFERETLMSTFCGRMIAIPHAVSPDVSAPALCIGRSAGFAWQAPDEWVRLVFLLAIPENAMQNERASLQVDVLSAIAAMALEEEHVQFWLRATSARQISNAILRALKNKRPAAEKTRGANR